MNVLEKREINVSEVVSSGILKENFSIPSRII